MSPAGPETARPADRPLAGRTVVVTRPREQAASLAGATRGARRRGAAGADHPHRAAAARRRGRGRPAASWRPTSSWCSRAPTPCACSPATWRAAPRTAACRPGPWSPPWARPPPRRWSATASPATSSPTSTSPRAWRTRWRGRTRAAPGARVLIPCARDARDVLPETLRERGAVVDVLHIYDTRRRRGARRAGGAGGGGRLHHVHVRQHGQAAGRAAAGGAAERGDPRPLAERLAGVRLCSIGPITSRALRELGLEVAVEAREYTAAGLVAAIAAYCAERLSRRLSPGRRLRCRRGCRTPEVQSSGREPIPLDARVQSGASRESGVSVRPPVRLPAMAASADQDRGDEGRERRDGHHGAGRERRRRNVAACIAADGSQPRRRCGRLPVERHCGRVGGRWWTVAAGGVGG